MLELLLGNGIKEILDDEIDATSDMYAHPNWL